MTSSFGGIVASNHGKAAFLVIIMVVSLAAGVYAYISSLSPQGGPRATITSPPLEFSMELDKAEYEYGKNVTITFCLKNTSNQTITVTKSQMHAASPYNILMTEADGASTPPENSEHLLSHLFHFDFSIKASNGTDVYQWSLSRFAFAATYDIVFEPYGYLKQTLVWDYDYGHGNLPLAKGTYQTRSILDNFVIQYGPGPLTLETPSITIMTK